MTTTPHEPFAEPASRLWWAVPAVGTVLLVIVAMFVGGGPETVDFGTSYDASGGGFRAAFLTLEQLKLPVERSRRPAAGGGVRWVLFPASAAAKEADQVDAWVQRGGLALLAVNDAEYVKAFGLRVEVKGAAPPRPKLGPFGPPPPPRVEAGPVVPADAPDVAAVAAGAATVTGPPAARTWGRVDGQPLVSVYPRGQGAVWLLHRPDVLCNANLREADNPLLLARLAEAMLAERPGGPLAFDEFCHGLRDRPSALDLMFHMPVLAVTPQVVVVAALVLWRNGTRFGPAGELPPPARRSKEEFLDALADLLARKGDRADAFRTVRDDAAHRLQAALGLPAGAPIDRTAAEARRLGLNPDDVFRLLSADAPPGGRGTGPFLDSLDHLDALAHDRRTRPPAR